MNLRPAPSPSVDLGFWIFTKFAGLEAHTHSHLLLTVIKWAMALKVGRPVVIPCDRMDGPGGGDVGGHSLHILVVLQLLLRATEQARDGTRLLGLQKAVVHAQRLRHHRWGSGPTKKL